MGSVANDLVREIERNNELRSQLRDIHKARFGLVRRTDDVRTMVEMLGMEETARRMDSRRAHLTFNGHFLNWIENGMESRAWMAVSGARGYQDKRHQHERDRGPIPQGFYLARQSQLQRWEDYSTVNRAACVLRAIGLKQFTGSWPGCRTAWGTRRIWLEPYARASTFGRDNFSIHGGTVPGSAGCIDLTFGMADFVDIFLKYGKNIELRVCY